MISMLERGEGHAAAARIEELTGYSSFSLTGPIPATVVTKHANSRFKVSYYDSAIYKDVATSARMTQQQAAVAYAKAHGNEGVYPDENESVVKEAEGYKLFLSNSSTTNYTNVNKQPSGRFRVCIMTRALGRMYASALTTRW